MTFLPHKASYIYMQATAPIRLITLASFTCASLLSAQTAPPTQVKPTAAVQSVSTLPATSATTTTEPAIPLTPSQQQPKHAQVTLANGSLSVSADNASLNQILRQISHETGMKITGGVVDERVFGQYGPAEPAQILAALLEGTGSNILLLHRDGDAPAELILTPRQGGPTPPNPNASTFDDKSDAEQPQPAPEQSTPTAEVPPGNTTVPPIVQATPNSAAPADGSQPDSPNGVKTPQQIYEQLQRMRQQQPPPQ
jgi:hypothetical protein